MRSVRIVLFALVWFGCSWFGSWEFNPNNAVRLFAAVSLVEAGDATIDEFADLTIDKAVFGGHAYLDKAPGMTLMALPAVAIARVIDGKRSADVPLLWGHPDLAAFLRLRLRLLVAIGPALLTALAAVLLFEIGIAATGSAGAGLFGALGYALGTPAWGWSTTILGHAPVAALYVVAIWAAWRRTRVGALLTGLALGAAVTIEFQAAIAGAIIAGAALWTWRAATGRGTMVAAALIGAAAALVPLAAYNLLAFGTVFRVGYAGVVGWEGMHQGLFGLGSPRAAVLWQITVGLRRGLVWVAPVLLLAPLGLAMAWHRRGTRTLAATAAAVTAAVLLVNAAYVYWDGGNSTGPRLAIPLVGVLALGLAPFWEQLTTRVERTVAILVLAVSIMLNAAIAAADIFAPPTVAIPIWGDVLAGRFAAGDLHSLASDYGGSSPWVGFAIWAAVALPAIGWLARQASRAYPAADRVTGASGSPQGSADLG